MKNSSEKLNLYCEIITDIINNINNEEAEKIVKKLQKLFLTQHTTGSALIAIERKEQIEKHNRTFESDIQNNKDFQLLDGARNLLHIDMKGINCTMSCPRGWAFKTWEKMFNKDYNERLIIAGALIAAEIDRLLHSEMLGGKG